jgi:hypothetical protein
MMILTGEHKPLNSSVVKEFWDYLGKKFATGHFRGLYAVSCSVLLFLLVDVVLLIPIVVGCGSLSLRFFYNQL